MILFGGGGLIEWRTMKCVCGVSVKRRGIITDIQSCFVWLSVYNEDYTYYNILDLVQKNTQFEPYFITLK
jgi:hypothetical protein